MGLTFLSCSVPGCSLLESGRLGCEQAWSPVDTPHLFGVSFVGSPPQCHCCIRMQRGLFCPCEFSNMFVTYHICSLKRFDFLVLCLDVPNICTCVYMFLATDYVIFRFLRNYVTLDPPASLAKLRFLFSSSFFFNLFQAQLQREKEQDQMKLYAKLEKLNVLEKECFRLTATQQTAEVSFCLSRR